MESPQSLGYRLPAEWEPQEAAWLSWPTRRETWPRSWESIQRTFAEIALIVSKYQRVFVNLDSKWQPSVERTLETVAVDRELAAGDIRFFNHPVNDVWVRDHGPIYLKHCGNGSVAVTDWRYNGWGEKYPFELDDGIPALIAREFELERFESSMVLEGGSVESNGTGDLLVTTDCLLNPNRNPGLSRLEIEARLQSGLAVDRVHWLDGAIEGDDTDGHIDNLVRFYKPDGVLIASVEDPDDPNASALDHLAQQCRGMTVADGRSVETLYLPLPERRVVGNRCLPMSYLNFYIANGLVLIPAFGQKEADAKAQRILSSAFPGREVVPIDCRELILQGGALHCLTQQVPQTDS